MKRKLFFWTVLFFQSVASFGQKQDININVERIFTQSTRILDCNYDETKRLQIEQTAHISIIGSQFDIVASNDTGFIIRFRLWNWKSKHAVTRNKAREFNYKNVDTTDNKMNVLTEIKSDKDNLKLFYVDKVNLLLNSVEAGSRTLVDIKLGALVVPFKFRFNPTNFSSDFSLGSVLMFQHQSQRIPDLTYGIGVGLSLSKVSLDSFSTSGFVRATTERPACTPSVNLLIGYKLINFTFAAGMDYINEISSVEKSWKYNGKPWIGFGFGVSLFTPGGDKALPKEKQKAVE